MIFSLWAVKKQVHRNAKEGPWAFFNPWSFFFSAMLSFYHAFILRSRIPAHPQREGRAWAAADSASVPAGESPDAYRAVPASCPGRGSTFPKDPSALPHHSSRSRLSGQYSIPHFPRRGRSGFGFSYSSTKAAANTNNSWHHLLYDTICKGNEKVNASFQEAVS